MQHLRYAARQLLAVLLLVDADGDELEGVEEVSARNLVRKDLMQPDEVVSEQ